jgi:hypothetical protein
MLSYLLYRRNLLKNISDMNVKNNIALISEPDLEMSFMEKIL